MFSYFRYLPHNLPIINTLKEYREFFHHRLASLYQSQEIDGIFRLVCEDLLNLSATSFLLQQNEVMDLKAQSTLNESLERLEQSVPVQHITGKAHFYGQVFNVDSNVLIPRQETEELVDWIINNHTGNPPQGILEVGTGSGCISISLGDAFAKADITATDISDDALKIAKSNATSILPNRSIRFIQQDILPVNEIERFDVIVSNPPYVRESEKVEIHKNVLDHEPANALFVNDNDPLIFYRKILELAKPHQHTLIFFEINQYLKTEMESLALKLGYQCEIRKDLNQNWRMMKCWQ